LNFSRPKFYKMVYSQLKLVSLVRFLSSVYCHSHFIICIASSAFTHSPSTIRFYPFAIHHPPPSGYGAPFVSKFFNCVMCKVDVVTEKVSPWCNVFYLDIVIIFTITSIYNRKESKSTLISMFWRDDTISTLISIYCRDETNSTLISIYYRDEIISTSISIYCRDEIISTLISIYYRDETICTLISIGQILREIFEEPALDLLWTRKTLNEVLVKAKQRLLNHTVSQAPHSPVVATTLISNIICVKKASFKMRPLRDVNFIISLMQGRKFITKFY